MRTNSPDEEALRTCWARMAPSDLTRCACVALNPRSDERKRTNEYATAAEVRGQLLRAWKLVSCQQIHQDGSVAYPLGHVAIGPLTYTDSGHVPAQLVRVGQPRSAGDDWQQATADEIATAWRGYSGYFGTFSVDIDAGAVIHPAPGTTSPAARRQRVLRGLHPPRAPTADGEFPPTSRRLRGCGR